MTNPATFLQDFTEGWAQYLADAGIGLTWHADGSGYATGEVGIYIASTPVDIDGQPPLGALVVLTPYPLTDDPAQSDSTIGLQAKSRSSGRDVRQVMSIDDAIANVVLGNYPLTLPNGVQVVSINGRTSTSLGKDDAQRWLWASSYPCGVYRPSAHRV